MMKTINETLKNFSKNLQQSCMNLEDYKHLKDSRNLANAQAQIYSQQIIQKFSQAQTKKT
ncbi:hypothetical protein [Acinetobacter sp. YH1901141]|uniref:hypothetical protein n=1 Tax=Acinetobacter sp. YH1901141 TaxID=2601201 RepID=UPI0015D44EC7|nr:hypothetical protein [Acinetobacter sp. YH1901141]